MDFNKVLTHLIRGYVDFTLDANRFFMDARLI